MPKVVDTSTTQKPCVHPQLEFHSSPHASEVNWVPKTAQQLATAAGKTKKESEAFILENVKEDFPAPLLLPEDDLSWDPKYPPQSIRSWTNLEERNRVTGRRKVLYVVNPPDVEDDAKLVSTWSTPHSASRERAIEVPAYDDVWDYIRAFYHGMEVKCLPSSSLAFATWDNTSSSRTKVPRYIGLKTSKESVRVRVRKCKDDLYPMQLNLNDILDVALEILPADAYALLMLVRHDLYEDEDDDFACGRAFGGSRVAVVSMARYHPSLDVQQNVERLHAWPASHCTAYVDQRCAHSEDDPHPPPSKRAAKSLQKPISSAMNDALIAFTPAVSPDFDHLTLLWLSRVCRTAAHELGHCFGIDHCVYYACSMQGTASIKEDVRQPPYLCPVDLEKVLRATAEGGCGGGDRRARYQALLHFCEQKTDGGQMFDAFGAWIRSRLSRLPHDNSAKNGKGRGQKRKRDVFESNPAES